MKKSQQRLRTHRALMLAVIKLMGDDRSFSSISLREVTREAGVVPATFYRHFNEMEDLAVELVEYCFRPLENLVMGVRMRKLTARQLVYESIGTFIRFARRHRLYFLFIIRERLGGRVKVRTRIKEQIHKTALTLSHDLQGLPEWKNIPAAITEDVSLMIMDQLLIMLDDVLDLPPHEKKQEIQIIARARKKAWIILRGGLSYRDRKNHAPLLTKRV